MARKRERKRYLEGDDIELNFLRPHFASRGRYMYGGKCICFIGRMDCFFVYNSRYFLSFYFYTHNIFNRSQASFQHFLATNVSTFVRNYLILTTAAVFLCCRYGISYSKLIPSFHQYFYYEKNDFDYDFYPLNRGLICIYT